MENGFENINSKKENAPSAFIKDPETMKYLIEKWDYYAKTEARDYRTESFGGSTFSREVFDVDPKLRGVNEHLGVRSNSTSRRYTLINEEIPGLFRESAERMHGVNFFNEVQNKINEKKSKNDKKPVKILVTGGDIAFFNDELRSKFGKDVNVYGTTVETSRTKRRKRFFVENIKNGKIGLPPSLQKYLSENLSEKLDPRDYKWRSILQMQSGEPEFDKIIDTCGELLYCYDKERPEIFEVTFKACISKLLTGGKLYIAQLEFEPKKFVEKYCKENKLILIENTYENRHQDLEKNFIITKT